MTDGVASPAGSDLGHAAGGAIAPAAAPGVVPPASPAVAAPAARGGIAVLTVVTLAHFVNDAVTSLPTPLLPQISDRYGVGVAGAGVLVATLAFVGSMCQPLVGVLGDRMDRRLLAGLGPMLAAVGMTLIGYAPSFGALAALFVLGGIGSAIFHPAGATYAVHGAGPRRGLFAALFSAGGTAGIAVGPLVATSLDLDALPWLMPVGLLVGALSFAVTPRTAPAPARRGLAEYAAIFRGPLRLLWTTSVLRSLSTVSYSSLIGFILTARDAAAHIGPSLAVFSLASAVGGIVGGRLSDRLGRTPVLRSSILVSVPLFLALAYAHPSQWWYYPLTALVGALVNANVPVTVVAAQEYAPAHVATASALMMGFAWGTAGVLFPLVGKLADLTSPTLALVASILVLLPAFVLTLRLPEPRGMEG